jgi:hypothetical protein
MLSSSPVGEAEDEMVTTKDKTISYHRAVYSVQNTSSIQLAACMKLAAGALTTPSQRTVDRGAGASRFLRLVQMHEDEVDDKAVFLHLVADTPGEKASVVSQVALNSKQIDVSTVAPPAGKEFMDGDAFVYIRANDLCYCGTGLHLESVAYFLQQFLANSKIRKDAASFELTNAVDVDKLALLQRDGVKEIQMRGTMFSASYEYAKRNGNAVGALEKISKHIKAFLKADHSVEADGLEMELTIKVDGRSKGLHLGEKRLQTIAADVLEHQDAGDRFIITTNSGDKIKPSEIYVKSTETFEPIGKSIGRDEAWMKLKEYYNSLLRSGTIIR